MGSCSVCVSGPAWEKVTAPLEKLGKLWQTNLSVLVALTAIGADLGLVLLWLVEKELVKYLDRHIAMTYLTILLSILDFPFSKQNVRFF